MQYQESTEFEKYGVQFVPTLILTDGEGNELRRVEGLVQAHQAGTLSDTIVAAAKAARQ